MWQKRPASVRLDWVPFSDQGRLRGKPFSDQGRLRGKPYLCTLGDPCLYFATGTGAKGTTEAILLEESLPGVLSCREPVPVDTSRDPCWQYFAAGIGSE
eukprot:1133665-Amphidinium_carterae.1